MAAARYRKALFPFLMAQSYSTVFVLSFFRYRDLLLGNCLIPLLCEFRLPKSVDFIVQMSQWFFHVLERKRISSFDGWSTPSMVAWCLFCVRPRQMEISAYSQGWFQGIRSWLNTNNAICQEQARPFAPGKSQNHSFARGNQPHSNPGKSQNHSFARGRHPISTLAKG